jgi:tRNA nucleotidyltransferase/poly(A) polymerase
VDKIIRNILTKIESSGYEAYLIGGYVRDLLVGKTTYDIDITTNATPRELLEIFPSSNTKNLGGIDFKIKEYHFEITTYREEIKYKNRKPIEYNYVDNLLTDLNRRDFTINAICMNKKGEIIDLINGTEDLRNYKIRMIGSIETKIKEDPLRILRGIRIATHLNFTIESNLYKSFKENIKEVLTLSSTRIKEEIDKILLSDYVRKGLKLLEELGASKILKIENYEDIVPIKSLEGMYAQIKIGYDLPFTKVEKDNIEKLKKILKEKEITKETIYQYGLYLCLIAADIKSINKKTINKMYKELPIHDKNEINIKAEELMQEFGICGKMISTTFEELEHLIINNKLKNKRSEIIKYLKQK